MRNFLTLSLATLFVGVATFASAQTAGPATGAPPLSPSGKAHKGAHKAMKKLHEAMLAKLSLTADQKAKIDAHDKAMETERKVVAKSEKGTKGEGKSEATKEKLKALRKENREFYKQTLTKDQRKEMKKMRREAMREATAKSASPTPKP